MGSEWTATATNMSSGQHRVLGKLMVEDSFDAIGRLEHFTSTLGARRAMRFTNQKLGLDHSGSSQGTAAHCSQFDPFREKGCVM